MPAPFHDTSCGEVQNEIGESVAVHVNVTVTLLLFHPSAFGAGDRLALIRGPTTVKARLLLGTPCFVTTTGPDEAPDGTSAAMLTSLQDVTAAAVPLNVTVLEACVAPKFRPATVTAWPAGPDAGVSDERTDCRVSTGAAMSVAISAAVNALR